MAHQNKSNLHKVGLVFVLAGASLGVAGCEQYLDRSDTITLGVADATNTNKAAQAITAWPAEARQDRWLSDGERARIAADRYRKRTVPEPRQLGKEATPSEPTPTEDAAKQ